MANLHLYDMDGTLLDSNYAHTIGYTYAFKQFFGLDVNKDVLMRHFGKALYPLVEGVCRELSLKPSIPDIEKIISLWERKVIENAGNGNLGLLDGVPYCLADSKVHRGVITFSNKNVANSFLNNTGLMGYFEIFSYGDIADSKIDIIRVAMDIAKERFNNIEHVVVFGDTPGDMEGGRAINAYCVGLLTGNHRREDLMAARPNLILDSLLQYEEIPINFR